MKNYNLGIIGNCTSAALITADCNLVWLCSPYFDSPSVFGKLLDEKKGGSFQITAVDILNIRQQYVHHTAILNTTFETRDGIFEVNDYMPRYLTANHEYYCPSEIHRNIRVLSGRPRIRAVIDAAPNYALGPAQYKIQDGYLKIMSTQGEYNSFYLYSNLDYQRILEGAEIELSAHSFLVFSYHEKLERVDNDKIYLDYEKTKTYWLDWVERTVYPKNFKKEVTRSAITLKLLMYQRTGAVIAAPTTSLPEIIGRDRNWDYRFCWIRDAAMIIDLYIRIGHMESANGFIDFILNRMLLKHEDIGVMYGIHGQQELIEKQLDHLSGFENSSPVRIGNDAYHQKQNDVYGELIETIYTYFVVNRRSDFQVNEEIWTMVRSLVNRVKLIWRNEDSGIWERREDMRHYVHSKLMSWVAFDRAVKIARFVGKPRYVEEWSRCADEVRQDILDNAWNERLQCFTMYYGSDYYDASNLLMLHYGFLDRKDPRMVSTVREYAKHLVKNGLTFRYLSDDEFGQPENAFIVCTFWMINALYLIGEVDQARQMFQAIHDCANHLGLFSEDVEIATKRLTGNFPQGYSHLAYIQTILVLETDYNWSDAFQLNNIRLG